MPNITSRTSLSIGSLPPEIKTIICEELNKNEKADDFELSHSEDQRNLGLAFLPEFLMHPAGSNENPWAPEEIYNILILKLVSNKNFPTVLFHAVLDFFVNEKGLDLNAALTLPTALTKLVKNKNVPLPLLPTSALNRHIIQRTYLMVPALKKSSRFRKITEKYSRFSFGIWGVWSNIM